MKQSQSNEELMRECAALILQRNQLETKISKLEQREKELTHRLKATLKLALIED